MRERDGGKNRRQVEPPRSSGRRGHTRRPAWCAGWVAAILLLAASLVPVVGQQVTAQGGRTFVVNSTADLADATSGDGVCAAVGAPSVCTLRAALQQANASTGRDRIEFDLVGNGPHRFTPLSAYPGLVDPDGVTIDGYTQPGSAINTLQYGSNAVIRIELRGQGPTGIDGLSVWSSNNTVTGLAIFDFQRNVRFWGPNARNNVIVGSFIGTDAAGGFGQPTRVISNNGVHLERGASYNRIGAPGRGNRNVISGNGDKGVAIYNDRTDGNTIMNNVIGLSPSGARLTNWGHGVDINFDASDNVVGGRGAEEGNVISGNELSGVEISHDQGAASTTGNAVIGNLIGTNLDGTAGSSTTRNREFGVNLEGKPTCPTIDSCGPDISDSRVEANTIVGSAAGVMIWKGARNSVVRDNRIGLLPSGTIAPSSVHTIWGVLIEAGAFDNLIDGNVIAGVLDGIQVRPDNDYTNEPTNPDFVTDGNTFRRNSIWGIVNGFGIDIAPIGVVNDDPDERSAGVQGAVQPPVVMAATEDAVTVSTCAGCLVEVFRTDADIASAYGQGRTFVGDATAGPTGVARLTLRTQSVDPYVLRTNERIAATVTDAAGNTSEFSLRTIVAPGSSGLPTSTTTTTVPTTTTTTTTTTTVPAITTTTTTTTTTTVVDARGNGSGGHLAVARRCGSSC